MVMAVVVGASEPESVMLCSCVTFELFTRRQLLPVGHSLADYESRVHSLMLVDMSGKGTQSQQAVSMAQ